MSVLLHLRKLMLMQSKNVEKFVKLPQRQMSAKTGSYLTMDYEKDPQSLFIDPETQKLLKSMTQLHIAKVYRKITVPDNTPEYKFMTTEELEKEFIKTIERARERLQMPPVVKMHEDTHKVISKDDALSGFSDTKYVFTDITFGLRQSERKVVVRHTDGTLEYAALDIAKRMNQIYFPLEGRKITAPRMFEEEHLQRCLDEHQYEFVLDRLTVQYEPYEPDYHRISSRVYQHLNESKEFDSLRSTRHFGPMAFFYAWHRCIDDLLLDMIKRDYMRNAVELIALMYKLNGINNSNYVELLKKLDEILLNKEDPALTELKQSIYQNTGHDNIEGEIHAAIGKTEDDFKADDLCLQFIENYIKEHANKKIPLELAVSTFKELTLEKQQLLAGLTKAHGLKRTSA